jgi:hypothetical protein
MKCLCDRRSVISTGPARAPSGVGAADNRDLQAPIADPNGECRLRASETMSEIRSRAHYSLKDLPPCGGHLCKCDAFSLCGDTCRLHPLYGRPLHPPFPPPSPTFHLRAPSCGPPRSGVLSALPTPTRPCMPAHSHVPPCIPTHRRQTGPLVDVSPAHFARSGFQMPSNSTPRTIALSNARSARV